MATLSEAVQKSAAQRELKEQVESHKQPCDGCSPQDLFPGVVFPIAHDGDDRHPYIQRCDNCRLFTDDLTAAVFVSKMLGFPLLYDETTREFYIDIPTEEAAKLRRQPYELPAELAGLRLLLQRRS